MDIDTKKYFDAAQAATAKFDDLYKQVSDAFKKGDHARALELKPQLDAAREEYQTTNKALVNLTALIADDGPQPQTIKRNLFNAMDPQERMRYIKGGGKVED